MKEMTDPSRSYLLDVVASLMTAWIVIRLGSGLIRNTVLAKTLAVSAWTLAALNILGLLDPTLGLLDSLAITFGDLRISLLTVIKGMAILAFLLWAATALSRVLESRIGRVPDLTPSVRVLLAKLLKITLLTLAVVIALNSVGIDLTALAVLSGAIGLGLGFGLQKVVSNLISGMILLLDKSIKPATSSNWAIPSVGSPPWAHATPRSTPATARSTLVPNEDLITHRVVNWSFSNEQVRLEVPVGVSYELQPPRGSTAFARCRVRGRARRSRARAGCHLVGFGDSSVDFVLRFWIEDPRNGVVNVKGQVLLAVWDALKEQSIGIPYPQRDLHIRSAEAVPIVSHSAASAEVSGARAFAWAMARHLRIAAVS